MVGTTSTTTLDPETETVSETPDLGGESTTITTAIDPTAEGQGDSMEDPYSSDIQWDDPALEASLSKVGTQHMSAKNAATYYKGIVPSGLGLCNDSEEYCIEAPWHFFTPTMTSNVLASTMMVVTGTILMTTTWIMLTLATIIGRIAYFGKPVRCEVAFTNNGPRLMFTLPKDWAEKKRAT